MTAEAWTIRRLLQWTTDFFRTSGIVSARLDAEVLLAQALHATRLDLYLDPDRPVDDCERAIFRDWVRQRAKRVPIAYLIGTKEFFSLPILVESGVLIPRPETELLVETVIAELKPIRNARIAELGVGSGCITAALAKELPDATFIAVDCSKVAIEIAGKNFERLGIDTRISLRHGSWYGAFQTSDAQSLHAIVSNPPYIASAVIPTLPPEISVHEPRSALDGGPDGLDAYRVIVEGAHRYLQRKGLIAVEIGDDQARAVASMLETANYCSVTVLKDLADRDRIVTGRLT